jgi:tetratricopeptide (TPR) repeat protein
MSQPTNESDFQRAIRHHQLGQLSEAEALYRHILTQQPKHAGALHFLGVIAHQRSNNDIALELIGQAIAIRPDYADAYSNLASVLRELGRLDEALAACRRAIALKPNYPQAYSTLGNVLKDQGQGEAAVAAYRRAIVLNPEYAEAYINLGAVLMVRGPVDGAIAACRQGIALQPNSAQAHYNLGASLRLKGQLPEAVAAYRQAIHLKPDYAEAYRNLGALLWLCGDLEETIECYRRAFELRPDWTAALANMADVLANLGRFDEAEVLFEKLATLSPPPARLKHFGRLGGQSSKLFIVCSIRNGKIDLLPHWLDHYSRLNADELLIGIFDDVAPEARAQVDRYSARWKFKTFRQTWRDTSELEQEQQRRAACYAAGADDDAWIIHTDLDELHEYPLLARQLIEAAKTRDIQVIYGWLLDRVAADGSMPPIPSFDDPASPSIWNAFSSACRLTGILLRAPTRKVMIARLGIEVGGGHHAAGGFVPYPIPMGRISQYIVHHFKWHKDTVDRMEWGLAHAGCNPAWQLEARRFLDWLHSNGGRINLNDPTIRT